MKRTAAAPRSERGQRSFWLDPRFAVGVVLVIGSVAGVIGVVSAADRRVEVWAARSALTPGDAVDPDDLVLRSVRLGEADGLYLPGEAVANDDLVITRSVPAGELVPVSAVGDAAGTREASVVVTVPGRLPQSVVAGAGVDIWSAKEIEAGVYGAPSVAVGGATVVRVIESESLIVDGSSVSVEVLVPRDSIAQLLESLANNDSMSLVPIGIPMEG
ncbi:hypothetical protein [Marisediminicola senii]|uniref:hypothetical protein n=1 Tax=Marisediminicola senii TaxID=2711233 RepID=UPI0013EBFF73|nr:hypothetical protein [Marisediminicola senii]